MIKKQLLMLLGICFTLLGCNLNKKVVSTAEKADIMVDYFTNNGFGNAVALVQHPAGIYHKGVTYVCYQGPLEDPYVASYNHKTKEWKGPFKAGISEMGKDPDRKKNIDNHGKPSIIIDKDDYIHITFGGHGGMPKHGKNLLGNYHYGKNLHAVSKKPLDISNWETINTIAPFGTYNQLLKMDNGDLYFFYRHGAHRSNWVYQKSTDNGITFEPAVSFLKHKRRTEIEAEDSWYAWITKGKGDNLIIAFDYHICRDVKNIQDARGHIGERHNLYYMMFNTETNVWRNVKNEPLQIPLTKEMADEKTLVANTATDWTFQSVADVDPNGNPHVSVQVGADIGKNTSAPKQMRYFRWNGKEWLQSENSGLPIGGGEIEVVSAKEVNMYLESKANKNIGEISRWESKDAGETFTKESILLRRENAGFAISSLIDNPHPDARIIVAEKVKGTAYRKMYLLGDNGPVQRSEKEVQITN